MFSIPTSFHGRYAAWPHFSCDDDKFSPAHRLGQRPAGEEGGQTAWSEPPERHASADTPEPGNDGLCVVKAVPPSSLLSRTLFAEQERSSTTPKAAINPPPVTVRPPHTRQAVVGRGRSSPPRHRTRRSPDQGAWRRAVSCPSRRRDRGPR